MPEYVQLFEDAYGSGPSFGRILGSIIAYVQSLHSDLTSYDEYINGDESALSKYLTWLPVLAAADIVILSSWFDEPGKLIGPPGS